MILGSGLLQAANTFAGAYDAIPSIAAAYSTRRLLASYEGPLLRLVADRTGYPEQDIGYTAAGDLDTAAAASFLAGDTGYVTKWYDQSGNTRDAAQATLAKMPQYVDSGIGAKPTIVGSGAQYLSAAHISQLDGANGMVVAGVLRQNAGVTTGAGISGMRAVSDGFIVDNFNDNSGARFAHPGAGAWSEAAIIESPSVLEATTVLIGRFDGTVPQNEIWRNGVQIATTATSGTTVVANTRLLFIFARELATAPFQGRIAEIVICSASLSTDQIGHIFAATNAYWSIY